MPTPGARAKFSEIVWVRENDPFSSRFSESARPAGRSLTELQGMEAPSRRRLGAAQRPEFDPTLRVAYRGGQTFEDVEAARMATNDSAAAAREWHEDRLGPGGFVMRYDSRRPPAQSGRAMGLPERVGALGSTRQSARTETPRGARTAPA